MTPAQNRKLHALRHERGFSIDELRAMTPLGSVSALTVDQAAILIDALERGISPDYEKSGTKGPGDQGRPRSPGPSVPRVYRPHRLPRLAPGTARPVTAKQLRWVNDLISEICVIYGLTPAAIRQQLAGCHYRAHNGTMDVIRTTDDGRQVIDMLAGYLNRAQIAQNKRRAAARALANRQQLTANNSPSPDTEVAHAAAEG